MSGKTANVVARVEPEVKAQAELIMEQLGISASTAINMFYRQIIRWNGMPFRPTLAAPQALDELTPAEFDAAMSAGLREAQAGQSRPLDAALDSIMKGLTHG